MAESNCRVCGIHREIHDVLRDGYGRLEHHYRLTIDGLIDALKLNDVVHAVKHSVCTQTGEGEDRFVEKQADMEPCKVPSQVGSGESRKNDHGHSSTCVLEERNAILEQDVIDVEASHDTEPETYDQMLPMNDLEASAIVSKAVAVFYPPTKETAQLHSLRQVVTKKLVDVLTRKKRNDILSHIKLTAMGCVRWRCLRCWRCFTSPRALGEHKSLCGTNDVRYGYLESKRHHFVCIVCGDEMVSRTIKTDMSLVRHTLAHSNEELQLFGLLAKK